jgi:hypothetical protein
MLGKKTYTPPQFVRVELNHEQAVLSVCSTMATTAMAGTTNMCRNNACKRAATTGNSAGRPS